MDLGYKHIIDNDGSALTLLKADGTAAATAAETVYIKIAGLGTFPKAALKDVVGTRYKAPSVFTNAIAFTAGAIANASQVSLTVVALTSRYSAEYSREAQDFGKRFSFSAKVAAGATATAVATAIQAAINARITAYNDLPFTVSRNTSTITLTGKAGQEDITVKLAYEPVKVVEIESGATKDGLVTVTENVTPGQEAINDGAWIEENVAMQTSEAARLGAARSDELVVRNGRYTSLYFGMDFTSQAIAEPSVVGEMKLSGEVHFGLFLNEAAKPADVTDPYGVLVEILAGVDDAELYEEDGSAVEGVDAAANSDDFWGLGGAGDVAPEA